MHLSSFGLIFFCDGGDKGARTPDLYAARDEHTPTLGVYKD